MATTNLNKIKVVIATIMALVVLAAAHQSGPHTGVVGGTKGWYYGYDYPAAQMTDLIVGDSLVFNYPPGKHNVVEVDEENYYKCTVPPGAKVHTSGADVIKFESPGRKYFICSVENGRHCREGNMKMFYDVPNSYYSSADSTGPNGLQGTRKLVAEKV